MVTDAFGGNESVAPPGTNRMATEPVNDALAVRLTVEPSGTPADARAQTFKLLSRPHLPLLIYASILLNVVLGIVLLYMIGDLESTSPTQASTAQETRVLKLLVVASFGSVVMLNLRILNTRVVVKGTQLVSYGTGRTIRVPREQIAAFTIGADQKAGRALVEVIRRDGRTHPLYGISVFRTGGGAIAPEQRAVVDRLVGALGLTAVGVETVDWQSAG